MRRFTWENFGDNFIAGVLKSPQTESTFHLALQETERDLLLAAMHNLCAMPDKQFVLRYRKEIEAYLLGDHPEIIESICKAIDIESTGLANQLQVLRTLPSSSSLLGAYVRALMLIGGREVSLSDNSRFTEKVYINLATSELRTGPLHDYQEEAVAKLKQHYLVEDKSSGVLVMPTGSGKTRTAVHFLLEEMVSDGYQIIWLTHRHMLINQTAKTFYHLSPLAARKNKSLQKLQILCVSGMHSTVRATERSDNVMILSVQSVYRGFDFLRNALSDKVMIVVDEAHHTLAASYQNTIKLIRKRCKHVKLLGLTATPVRISEKASKQLMTLFDNTIVYSIPMSELIVKKVLSDPMFERVETHESFEPLLSLDEKAYIQRYGDLPERLVDIIATTKSRNQLIVDRYVRQAEQYGKTLVFAMNKMHCVLLCDEFQKNGIKADYVYSGMDDNERKIQRFQDGDLQVLININIMTEGSDLPQIETVFLTRPTQSEGLLMQMIGRGMRGPAVGGTETVRLVDFCDKWDVFTNWLNPEWLLGEEREPMDAAGKYRPVLSEQMSWDLCRDIYAMMSFQHAQMGVRLSLPSCWYALVDEDGNDFTMLVFEDQLPGMLALHKDLQSEKPVQDNDMDAILTKYFGGFVTPPNTRELALFIENMLHMEEKPQRFILKNRKQVDPAQLGARVIEENLNPIELARKTYDEFPMVQHLYGTVEDYTIKVTEHAVRGKGMPAAGMKIDELPVEMIPFRQEPCHDLPSLVREVTDEMFGGTYEGIEDVEWTDKGYKTYYGICYHPECRIRINRVLNSPDVPRDVIKYLLYHEMLHRDYRYHDKAFRALEYRYPEYVKWDKFLDYHMGKFDIKTW
jgi:superfamily II DNA or RNA helicase